VGNAVAVDGEEEAFNAKPIGNMLQKHPIRVKSQ
jgi:hypothetical protein